MKRTSAYIFTADTLCSDSMRQINLVQRTVRAINARNKLAGNPKRFRISLKARLGKNNPAAIKYRGRPRGASVWGAHAYQTIAIADAQRIDVYIHPRN